MAGPGEASGAEEKWGQLALGPAGPALDRPQPVGVKRDFFQVPASFFPMCKATQFK